MFQPLTELPFSLMQGNLDEQLDRLAACDPQTLDPLSLKVRFLLEAQMPRARLKRALGLAMEVPFTINLVEQNHAGAALLLRQHRTYTAGTLCARSFLHQAKRLLGMSRYERRLAYFESALEKLQIKAKGRRNGQNIFLRLASQSCARPDLPGGVSGHAWQRALVKAHAGAYKDLPAVQQQRLTKAAAEADQAKRAEVEDQRGTLQTQLRLLKSRESQERATSGVPNHCDAMRFPAAVIDRMCDLANDVPRSLVQQLLSRKMRAPECPSDAQQELFLRLEDKQAWPKDECPWWAHTICAFRERFVGVAVYAESGGALTDAFLLLFAKKKPFTAVFLRLQRCTDDVAMLGLPYNDLNRCCAPRHRQTFLCAFEHCLPAECGFSDDADLFVLRDVRVEGSVAVCYNAPTPFEIFTSPFASCHKAHKKRDRATKRPKVSDDVRARTMLEFGWLTDVDFGTVAKPRSVPNGASSSSRGGRERGGGPPAHGSGTARDEASAIDREADEGLVDEAAVLMQLRELRDEAADLEETYMGFYTHILGGAWTAKHKQVCADAVVGRARGGVPSRWCRLFQWPKQMAAYYSKYGQVEAHELAREWCRRAQWFYSLWLRSEQEADFIYRQEDLQSCPERRHWLDFMAALPPGSVVMRKAEEIHGLVPAAEADATA